MSLDMSKLVPTCPKKRRVQDIVEPMPLDDKAWRDMTHIAKKNSEHGHNHKMCVAEILSVPAIQKRNLTLLESYIVEMASHKKKLVLRSFADK